MKCTKHTVLPNKGHASVLAHPQLRAGGCRFIAFANLSYDGWKIGYCVAPGIISAEIRKSSSVPDVCVNTHRRTGVGDKARRAGTPTSRVTRFTGKNAMCWLTRWRKADFKCCPCEGTYFLLIDYSAASTLK